MDSSANPVVLPERFARWFAARGWDLRWHQARMLAKAEARRSALLIAPTGAGKTLAGFLPSLVELAGRVGRCPREQRRAHEPQPDVCRLEKEKECKCNVKRRLK